MFCSHPPPFPPHTPTPDTRDGMPGRVRTDGGERFDLTLGSGRVACHRRCSLLIFFAAAIHVALVRLSEDVSSL